MSLQERRVAQIVRDFLEAGVLWKNIQADLDRGPSDFRMVERLIGDTEESALYRLKEECHALFRQDGSDSDASFDVAELFDLAVAALFHEGMKFRESYYLTTTYGPRLAQMTESTSAPSSLVRIFRRVFEAGRRRMLESASEVANLFCETRDQLRILLRQLPSSGVVARSLIENPDRTEQLFEISLPRLLGEVCGNVPQGYLCAIDDLVESGHYTEAGALLSSPELRQSAFARGAFPFAQGMAQYYAGDARAAVEDLRVWIEQGAEARPEWIPLAQRVLGALGSSGEDLESELQREARGLSVRLLLERPA